MFYTISNFAPETVITLENIKEILADMGVEYTPKKRCDGISMPSIYKDGKAYETKFASTYLRKGCPARSRYSRIFLEGKTIQEVLDFLNNVKLEKQSADNYIQRPGLKASAHITIDEDKPVINVIDWRPTSMEGIRSLDPKRGELLDKIFRGPKKRGAERRPSNNRVGDNRKPTYNITTGELSETVTHIYRKGSAYQKEMVTITKSCEYQKPAVAPGEVYDGQQFQWAGEMPMEKLEEILAAVKEAKCKTYADYKKKMAKKEAKTLAKDFTQAVNTVNGNLSDAVAIEILAQLKKLNAGMEKLTAMWE